MRTERFNGTEFLFIIEWNATQSISPISAQLVSVEYSSGVYDVSGRSAIGGIILKLPFPVTPAASLTDIHLYISIREYQTGQMYTLTYTVPSATAQPGNLPLFS